MSGSAFTKPLLTNSLILDVSRPMFLRYFMIRVSICGLSRNVYRHLDVGNMIVMLGGGPLDTATISGRDAISFNCMVQYLWGKTLTY